MLLPSDAKSFDEDDNGEKRVGLHSKGRQWNLCPDDAALFTGMKTYETIDRTERAAGARAGR